MNEPIGARVKKPRMRLVRTALDNIAWIVFMGEQTLAIGTTPGHAYRQMIATYSK